jgi:hypothetical protein
MVVKAGEQRAQRVAQVAPEVFEPARPPRLPALLAVELAAAESEQRTAPRFVGGQAVTHEVFSLELDVLPHLLLHLAIAGAPCRRPPLLAGSTPPAHVVSSL